jgi:hypothetical protein
MDDRERRIAENEIVYRTVNEKIEDLNEAFGTLTDTMTVVCECGDESCGEQIELDVRTYERVRSEPTHFVILPGHVVPEVESVVEHGDGFDVVRKDPGEAAELAVEYDPRS